MLPPAHGPTDFRFSIVRREHLAIGSAGNLWPHLRVTYGPTPDRQTLGRQESVPTPRFSLAADWSPAWRNRWGQDSCPAGAPKINMWGQNSPAKPGYRAGRYLLS